MAEGQVNPEGNQDPSGDNNLGWRAGLPDEFKEHDWAKAHGKVGDFFKDAVNVKTEHDALKTKMEGALFKPSDDATDEQRAEFYNKLGRPEKPDGYEFKQIEWPESVPDWLKESSEHELNEFKSVFHNLGLTQEQAQQLTERFLGNSLEQWNESQSAIQKKQEDAKSELQKAWGNDYDANIELAKRGAERAGELAGIKDDFIKFMEDSRLGDDPIFVKIFYGIGKAISEDSALFGDSAQRGSSDGPVGPDGRRRLKFPSMGDK